MYSMEDCQILVMSVKIIRYHHRLIYFLMWDLEKFKEILHCVCKGHTQSPSLFSLAHMQLQYVSCSIWNVFMKKYKMCIHICQGTYKHICEVTWASFCPQTQSSISLCLEDMNPSVFTSRRRTNEAVFQQLKTITRDTDQLRLDLNQWQKYHHHNPPVL